MKKVFNKFDRLNGKKDNINIAKVNITKATVKVAIVGGLVVLSGAAVTPAFASEMYRDCSVAIQSGGTELNNCDFYKRHLQGRELKNVNFSGSDFTLANLSETDLRGANFNGALLSPAHADLGFFNASFLGLDADGQEKAANLSGTNLEGLDLRNVKNHYLIGVNMVGAKMANTNLSDMELSGASFKGADLKHANLKGSIIRKADFRGADLRDADLSTEKIALAKFDGAIFNDKTRLPFGYAEAVKRGMVYRENDPASLPKQVEVIKAIDSQLTGIPPSYNLGGVGLAGNPFMLKNHDYNPELNYSAKAPAAVADMDSGVKSVDLPLEQMPQGKGNAPAAGAAVIEDLTPPPAAELPAAAGY